MGIYWIGGITWAADVENICANGAEDLCGFAGFMLDFFPYSLNINIFDQEFQNFEAQRYQEYVKDWSVPDNMIAEEFDLESITIPISIMVAEYD